MICETPLYSKWLWPITVFFCPPAGGNFLVLTENYHRSCNLTEGTGDRKKNKSNKVNNCYNSIISFFVQTKLLQVYFQAG